MRAASLVWPLLLVVLLGCEQAPQLMPPPDGMVQVPAGEFIMGSDAVDTEGKQAEFGFREPMYLDEHPRHRVRLDAFYIDRYEVSNGEYKRFVLATGIDPPPPWVQDGYNASEHRLSSFDLDTLRRVAGEYFQLDMDTTQMEKDEILAQLKRIQAERDRLPVTAINWYDAASYCRWRGKRLPSEAEWEKAARGADGRRYPWGDAWDPSRANVGDNDIGVTVPPGSYPQDKSIYGVFDLGGNVSEWVNDWYRGYPGADYQSEAYGDVYKVVKGGGAGVGHYALSYFYRSARRGQADPLSLSVDVGFRCAKSGEYR
ncbi:hypothetical protein Tel_00085 [Candidatus Tenderia electrophaga]|jgi:formylglycine-generating enzyme required for sulfatase activity|uniref:Sulfatase-modifying factor enzyme-like domain-containing protein n=1 Tax=Candidatus Tenderia electrophaga TaxID=1748243 RepID=A0A0S2T937_9GAMM|nr:hypothetical protein Tel_00085 [Candidatus Tenderia electrophaga]